MAFAQDFNKLDEKGLKQGTWKGIYEESKRPRYQGTFEHGKEIGLFKFFDDTKAGTIIATREFNAKDNSCYTTFFNQKSNKVSEGKVVNKKFDGEWKYYHENLPIIMTTEFYANGKLNGVRKVFYRNGNIAEETTYVNDVKEGNYKKYTENGVILEETIYKKGEYDGQAIFRGADNQISGQGLFKNGKKVGMWKILEEDKLKNVNMNKQGKKFQKKVNVKEN
jgi:antitoxin component YwqK of YwqJK toxin-antitoxin module